MLTAYIQVAMDKAQYEIIDDPEPFYGSIPGLRGVWATGRTLEECRRNLAEALDGWIVFRLQQGLKIPTINGARIPRMKAKPTYA